MALKQRFIKMLLALIAVCAFTACTNPADGTAGGNTGGGGTPSVPEYTVRFSAGEGGTITAKAGGQNIVSGSKVKKDTLVTFTAAPSGSTYTVGEWTIASPAVFKDGGEKGSLTAEVYVTEDITIGVQFEQVTPPPAGQVRLAITGDERLVPHTCYVDTAKDTVWSAALKTQIEAKLALKTEWQGGDYGVYVWKLGSENGETLTNGHTFAQDTVVYAVTNYTKFRINGTVLEGYASGHEPRGSIIIPDGVTEIKEDAFQNCRDLTGTLVFPQSLQKIKDNPLNNNGAFKGCTGLTGLDFSACTELTEIGSYAFEGCTGFTGSLDLSVYTKLTKIGSYAFRGCSGFSGALKLPANITEIGHYAFDGCTGFTGSLDLSACTQLTTIGDDAFESCSGFSGELKLPANITEIDFYAFSGCTQAEIKLPQSITKVGSSAFGNGSASYCKKVKIPNGTEHDRIKTLVTQSFYLEERIESY